MSAPKIACPITLVMRLRSSRSLVVSGQFLTRLVTTSNPGLKDFWQKVDDAVVFWSGTLFDGPFIAEIRSAKNTLVI